MEYGYNGPSGNPVAEQSGFAVLAVCGSDRDLAVFVYKFHMSGFLLPVLTRTLNDAQGVYPEVANAEPKTDLNRFSERAWQIGDGEAAPKDFRCLSRESDRLITTPTMT